jgi:hypothetical protein
MVKTYTLHIKYTDKATSIVHVAAKSVFGAMRVAEEALEPEQVARVESLHVAPGAGVAAA